MRDSPPSTLRALLQALFAGTLFGVYGVKVCPFLEELEPWRLVLPIAVALAAALAVRRALFAPWVDAGPLHRRSLRCFVLDLGLYASCGVGLAAFNHLTYGFPGGSAFKVLFGFTLIGFFVASDLALFEEYHKSKRLVADGSTFAPSGSFVPFTRKLTAFTVVTLTTLTLVGAMIVDNDLAWLVDEAHIASLDDAQQVRASISLDLAYVGLSMAGYVLLVLLGYARNLNLFLDQEARTLEQVARGVLRPTAPATTNDERGYIAHLTNQMIERLARRNEELSTTQEVTILCLASLAETRDNETGMHILRTQRYVRVLAEELRGHPDFAGQLDDEVIDLLFKSAPLHDIGKVGIPDRILLKPGRLTEEEWAVMRTHTRLGAEALRIAEERLGSTSFLRYAREIALSHHERWDGSGYPGGLAGDAIPLSGRLMALADVYDALITRRVYKPAFTHEEARRILLEGRGTHFDPRVVEAFVAREQDFVQIALEYADSEAVRHPFSLVA